MSSSLLAEKTRLVMDLAHTAVQIPRWISLPHQAPGSVPVKQDAFGVNVASAEDSRCDDYVIGQLRSAAITHVRLAWDVDSQHNHTKRFLERLLSEGFDVMVALLPTFADAKRLEQDIAAANQWRNFLVGFFQQYGNQITLCEIGNTPNRPSWSGYTPVGYLKAWEIAAAEAQHYQIELAGPERF